MTKIYEVNRIDFTNETAALIWAAGRADDEWSCLVTFVVTPNLPGCLPATVARSCSMRKVFADGTVQYVNIWG